MTVTPLRDTFGGANQLDNILRPSFFLKYRLNLIFILGLGAIGTAGVHFLWKIIILLCWLTCLSFVKKIYTTTHFDVKSLKNCEYLSFWMLVFKGPIIVFYDQTSKEQWCAWIFKIKRSRDNG